VSRALPHGYTTRPAARDDAAALGDLWRRSDVALGVHPEDSATFVGWVLQLPYVRLDRDTVVVMAEDAPAAFALAQRDPASPGADMTWFGIVDPAHLGRGLGSWLVGWADDLVARRSDEQPFAVRCGVPGPDVAAHELLLSRGYVLARTTWDMSIDVAGAIAGSDPPVGVSLRAFEEGRDERTFWEIAEATFVDHFGHSPTPYETWVAEWYETDDWDPDRVLLAERDGEVVGELGWIASGTDGYIATLGVLQAHRGRGIAKALLRAAFADIRAKGFTHATLSVDVENVTGALQLYEAVGMRQIREFHFFERVGR
jgi:mycothiol synthase